ncbi:MAG: hypothetical protein U1F77_00735 [Kiritimatiellia bacterium]
MNIPFISLPSAPPGWADIDTAGAGIPGLPFRQAWRSEPDPAFQPGDVAVMRTSTHLVVVARMNDAHAGNPSRGINGLHFQKGDVFEVFLKPPGGEAYWEVHVTPEGETYQVRIPSAAAFLARRKEGLSIEELVRPYLLDPPVARVMARNVDSRPGWDALILFPLPAEAQGEWRFSACRYDSDGRGAPVLSSISPLTRPDFHFQADWRVIRVGPPPEP